MYLLAPVTAMLIIVLKEGGHGHEYDPGDGFMTSCVGIDLRPVGTA